MLSNELLNLVDMSSNWERVPDFFKPYYAEPSGTEHYRLLTHIAYSFDGISICDVGTNRGASALALAQNQKNKVYSIDVVDVKENDIGMPNVEFLIGNFRHNDKIKKTILNSKVILLDIDHLYDEEIWLYNFLVENEWDGYMFCDDIHLNEPMKRFWSEIALPKIDLTTYGHITGTGCVFFNQDLTFDML